MPSIRQLLGKAPMLGFLRPAWFDEARLIVQGFEFERLTASAPLSGRVLNAGCGEGLYSAFLESFGDVREITNVDLAAPSIAAQRKDPRHRDEQASLIALPFDTGSFDGCLCSEVLEHIPDDGKAVAELARCLKPGAALLLSVPTPPAPFDRHHVREGYTLVELKALLTAHGFEIEAHAYCFYWFIRVLYELWHGQHRWTGRNWFPRAAVRAFGHLDRRLPVGRPWDLVVRATRT